jgi:hypothetical protein
MNENIRLIIGLAFLGLLAVSLGLFAFWNIVIKKRSIRRVAKEDLKLVDSGEITEDELAERIKSMVPALLTANSILAAIMIAAVFIVVSQVFFSSNFELLKGLRGGILIAAFSIASIAAISWLFVIEQLTQIIAPSAKPARIIKFHIYNYDLWFYSLFMILIDIYLFLLLVHLVAAIVAGIITFWIVLIYWRIHNEW